MTRARLIVGRILKISLAVVVATALLSIGLSAGLSYYDSHTKDAYLRVAAQELSPHASHADMTEFMRRHTAGFAYDGKYQRGYAGLVPQTRFDQFLFNRKVQVLLNVDVDQTFRDAEIRVSYTFL